MRRRLLGAGGSFLLVLSLAALLAGSAGWAASDPFYTTRLREGTSAYERGDYEGAVQSLRVACFGLLDEEPLLAECLVRLGLAQASSGDREGFRETFRRVVEAEEILGLYNGSELPSGLRREFERRVEDWIADPVLAASPGFEHLAGEPEETEGDLDERRRDLARAMEEEPRDPRWPLLLARLERRHGDPETALEMAGRAAELRLQGPAARCELAWARIRTEGCEAGVEDLSGCQSRDPDFAETLLFCRVEARDWETARRELREVPPVWREEGAIETLAGEIRSRGEPEATGGALPDADRSILERAKDLMASARSIGDLEEAYELVRDVEERFPASSEVELLAGEIAYRASRWEDAVRHFEAAGEPRETRPRMLFYLAVSLFESGRRDRAEEVLRRCLGRLERTPFVERYRRMILGDDGGARASG